jgi:hypothetical protein
MAELVVRSTPRRHVDDKLSCSSSFSSSVFEKMQAEHANEYDDEDDFHRRN